VRCLPQIGGLLPPVGITAQYKSNGGGPGLGPLLAEVGKAVHFRKDETMHAILIVDSERFELKADKEGFRTPSDELVDLAYWRVNPGSLIITDEPQKVCQVLGISFPDSRVRLHQENREYIGGDVV
jgi:hypothetical protein